MIEEPIRIAAEQRLLGSYALANYEYFALNDADGLTHLFERVFPLVEPTYDTAVQSRIGTRRRYALPDPDKVDLLVELVRAELTPRIVSSLDRVRGRRHIGR